MVVSGLEMNDPEFVLVGFWFPALISADCRGEMRWFAAGLIQKKKIAWNLMTFVPCKPVIMKKNYQQLSHISFVTSPVSST